MSICNIRFDKDSVILLTDQMVYSADNEPVALAARKAEMGDGFVWSTRGSFGLGEMIDAALADARGFDHALAVAGYAVGGIEPSLIELGRSIEVTIAGPSKGAGDLRCVRITRRPAGTVVEEYERGTRLSPSSSALPPLPGDIPLDKFVRLAWAQQKISDEFNLKGCVGGAAHFTGVNGAGETYQEIAGLYPTYDQDAAALGDPNADEVAAWRRRNEYEAA